MRNKSAKSLPRKAVRLMERVEVRKSQRTFPFTLSRLGFSEPCDTADCPRLLLANLISADVDYHLAMIAIICRANCSQTNVPFLAKLGIGSRAEKHKVRLKTRGNSSARTISLYSDHSTFEQSADTPSRRIRTINACVNRSVAGKRTVATCRRPSDVHSLITSFATYVRCGSVCWLVPFGNSHCERSRRSGKQCQIY